VHGDAAAYGCAFRHWVAKNPVLVEELSQHAFKQWMGRNEVLINGIIKDLIVLTGKAGTYDEHVWAREYFLHKVWPTLSTHDAECAATTLTSMMRAT
jgi:hypothetical protein